MFSEVVVFSNKRPRHSQHFLRDRRLVKKLVGRSSVGKKDTVIEIGTGKGIITRELLAVAGRVVGVEIDKSLTEKLKSEMDDPRLTIYCQDFLKFPLPVTEYCVFANIPFELEGMIIRKLLDGKNPPKEMSLVVIKNVGERWVGYGRESLFSLTHKPWFEMSIGHRFKRSDFRPEPRVDSIMIKVVKRKKSLVDRRQKRSYIRFVTQGFCGGRRIDRNLRTHFSKGQLTFLAREFDFSTRAKPSDLKLDQWLKLFLAHQQ